MKWLVLLSVLLFAALAVAVVLEVAVPILLVLGFGSVLAAVLEGERRR